MTATSSFCEQRHYNSMSLRKHPPIGQRYEKMQCTSTQTKCQPEYVIVDFPQYCGHQRGHQRMAEKTWVPIPVVEMNCGKRCCQLQNIPLTLAYSKACHCFVQGQTAGKNNMIPCNIVQLVLVTLKGSPGLFYVFLSRATVITSPGDRSTSAIFFKGQK